MDSDQPFRFALILGALMVFPVLAAAWHRDYAGTAGVPDQSGMDGLVIRWMAGLAAVDGSGCGHPRRRAVDLDGSHARSQPHGHRGDAASAFLGHDRGVRWVRHPFYVATGLAIVANALATANWFRVASFVVGGVAPLEENGQPSRVSH